MTTYYLKTGDTLPRLGLTLTWDDGTAIDLTNAQEVRFVLAAPGALDTAIVDEVASIDDAVAGEVSVGFTAPADGTYLGQWRIYWGAGQTDPQTVPNQGFDRVVVGGVIG